ncbi:MAG: FAD-binding oxidoreductase, partial [Gemmatimonadaceae bacterium]
MSSPPSQTLIAKLESIVGVKWVRKRAAELQVFDADGLPGYRMLPALAVLPGTRDELIAVVRALAEDNVA